MTASAGKARTPDTGPGAKTPDTGAGTRTPTATRAVKADDRGAPRPCLLVIGEHSVATHFLPPTGEVVLGRLPSCDIYVDDPSVSRRHARLIIGTPMMIEDLGSANGTRVGSTALLPNQPVPLAMGDVAVAGSVSLVIQHRTESIRPRRVWPHDYFEGRLEEECARAQRAQGTFAVLRIRVEGDGATHVVTQTLADVLRLIDVIGTYAPRDYEVLLIDARPAEAEAVQRRLKSALDAAGAPVRIGMAHYPGNGRSPDELLSRAGAIARGEPITADGDRPLVVRAPSMMRLYALMDRIAAGDISVLILGETGVGKEVLAQALHKASPRAHKPMLSLSCVALSETLLESELFGYEKGAFTGATQTKQGLLETADGGTVFLDEIGELPMSIQVKLLRVIETREVLRVGALKSRPIDVRFVSATNRDLDAEVARSAFRQDLFFRLNGISLVIPPLRERVDEIESLVLAFVAASARQTRMPEPRLSTEALALLKDYSWPGNIRELRNVIERAVLLAGGGEITADHLPVEKMRAQIVVRPAGPAVPVAPPEPAAVDATGPVTPAAVDVRNEADLSLTGIRAQIEAAEKERIREALLRTGGNQAEAAELLGISRRTLINKLDAYGLERPRKGKPRRPRRKH